MALLAAGAAAVASEHKRDKRNGDGKAEPVVELGKAHPADYFPVLKNDHPIFILVLGSDSRSKQPGAIAHGRADSIHIVGINPKKQAASILGFPRDSWVEVPGHGKNKINDSMYYGGPKGAVDVVEKLTGIKIDYYALAGFFDFRALVSEVGNVKVDVPYDMDDDHAKAHFKKGNEVMTGKEALAFVRARYDVPGGDLGRSRNQGYFLVQMLQQFKRQFQKDPSDVTRYLGAVLRNVETDLPLAELARLAFTVAQIDPKNVTNGVLPARIGHEGAESVVYIESGAASLYADLKKDGLIRGGTR